MWFIFALYFDCLQNIHAVLPMTSYEKQKICRSITLTHLKEHRKRKSELRNLSAAK